MDVCSEEGKVFECFAIERVSENVDGFETVGGLEYKISPALCWRHYSRRMVTPDKFACFTFLQRHDEGPLAACISHTPE